MTRRPVRTARGFEKPAHGLATPTARPASISATPFFASTMSWLLAVLLLGLAMPFAAAADSVPRALIGEQLALSDSPRESALRPLDALLAVPESDYVWHGDRTDEDLAFAVTLGNDPALEKRNPFRKRSIDLFRAERPVVIKQREMLLRLRVRAKSRETMSVELKF